METPDLKNIIHKKRIKAKSLYDKGDFSNAARLYSELCKESADAETHYMMGVLFGQSSNHIHAQQHITQALRLDSNHDMAWGYQGVIQASQGEYASAILSFNKSIEINPDNTHSLNSLGNAYRELGKQSEAEASYKKALLINKNDFVAVNNIANIYLTICQYDKAEKYYKRAISLNKNYFDAYYNLGATYQSKGDHKLAINYYKRAQKLKPDDITPQTAIANSYEKQGKLEKALEFIEPLLSKNIITAEIADIYSKICLKNKNYDNGISVIKKCLSTRTNPILEQALHYSLGDILDKKKCFDEAFEHYKIANSMRPYHYEKTSHEISFRHIQDVFSNAEANISCATISNSNTPIFIIGMPRSGTSLIEQILSSHSEVCGAGELPYLGELAEQPYIENSNLRYPDNVENLNSEKLIELANAYLLKIKQHGDGSHYISDKMPHNFLYVGLIRRLFPNCKIIHCLRNPLDVCLSVYFHNFNQNHPYSDSLNSLGHYYNQYRELMSFWQQQYDDLIIDIRYEDLLSNAESNVKKLLQHVGLEWQEGCLKYYENKRTVSTPSYAQVTQPLYTTSMERWRNYSKHLEELKVAINDIYL